MDYLIGVCPPLVVCVTIILFWLIVLCCYCQEGYQIAIGSIFPIIISAIFWKLFLVLLMLAFVLLMILLAYNNVVLRFRTNYPNNNWTNNPAPQPVPTVPQYQLQANHYLHGTSYENAMEIFKTMLWLVGGSIPRGVYLTKDINIARSYSQNNGAIVVVNVTTGTNLKNLGGGVYVYEILGVQPYNEYYKIQSLTPVAVLNYQGNKIG